MLQKPYLTAGHVEALKAESLMLDGIISPDIIIFIM